MIKIINFLRKILDPNYLTEEEQQIVVERIIEKIRASC